MIFHRYIEKQFQKRVFVRYDGSETVHYFSHRDFPGLIEEPYPIPSSRGHTLAGRFYRYEGADTSRLLVFEHGLGGGHRSYMKEIERLCRAGYRVFAYDHTGCMESGGESVFGFSQSLHDLDDCLRALKRDPGVNTDRIAVVGHSWGGYATLNIPALHPDVERIVVLSGFLSAERIIAQNLPGPLRGYRKHILALEAEANPAYFAYDATESLQKANTRGLLIYSDNDSMVQKRDHYDVLAQALGKKENLTLWLLPNKGHNPNYTAEALSRLADLASRSQKEKKTLKTKEGREAFKASFDWDKMTEQDESVWERILTFLQ